MDCDEGAFHRILAVIEHGTRRVRVLGATEHPVESWVVQQARNLAMDLEDTGRRAKFVLHDRDACFTAAVLQGRRPEVGMSRGMRRSAAGNEDHLEGR